MTMDAKLFYGVSFLVLFYATLVKCQNDTAELKNYCEMPSKETDQQKFECGETNVDGNYTEILGSCLKEFALAKPKTYADSKNLLCEDIGQSAKLVKCVKDKAKAVEYDLEAEAKRMKELCDNE